jgi:hypothetical protein
MTTVKCQATYCDKDADYYRPRNGYDRPDKHEYLCTDCYLRMIEQGLISEDEQEEWNLFEQECEQPTIEELKAAIENWDRDDINELLQLLLDLESVIEEPMKLDQVVDMTDLPSMPIPNGLEMYPIWSMDQSGFCLVGAAADSIEHIKTIREWYAEKYNQTISITVESSDGNKFVKTISARGFDIIGDDDDTPKIARPQGTSAGINLPITTMGNRVIAIVFK